VAALEVHPRSLGQGLLGECVRDMAWTFELLSKASRAISKRVHYVQLLFVSPVCAGVSGGACLFNFHAGAASTRDGTQKNGLVNDFPE